MYFRRHISALSALLAICIGGALISCAGSGDSDTPGSPAAADSAGIPEASGAPLGLPELPAPSAALAGLRSTSELKLSASGAEFEALLPNNHATVVDSAVSLDPQWLPQDSKEFGDLAYAMYRLNLDGHEGDRLMRLISASGKPDPSQVYIGLADWEMERWDFYRLGASTFFLPKTFDLAGYEGDNGDVLVVVVVLGDQPLVLGELTVEPFDEVEPNDLEGDAQLFDSGSPAGFRAHVGGAETIDTYLIPGSGADYISIEARHNDSTTLKLTLYRAGGELYQTRSTFSLGDEYSTLSDDEEMLPEDFPMRLTVEALTGETDYTLDIGLGSFPTIGLLNADPPYGDLPFTTTFSTDAVNEPGVIYRWDVDNDNRTDAFTSEPTLTWTYTVDGFYICEVAARSPQGLEIFTDAAIIAGDGPYHERENNDTDEQANPLDDSVAESGWFGNAGEAFSGGYDGDTDDKVSFTVPAGQAMAFLLEDLDNPIEESELFFFNAPFYPGLLGRPQMVFNADDEPDPEIITIRNLGFRADYKLTWSYGTPPTLTILSDQTVEGTAPFELTITSSVEGFGGKTVEDPQWDIDGDYVADGAGLEFTHTFTEAGSYTITGYAYDEDGLYGVAPVFLTLE